MKTLAFSLTSLLLAAPALSQNAPAQPAAPSLAMRTVDARGVSLAVPLDGTVEALRQSTVASQVAGRILEMSVDAGQRVSKGQALASIDARESAEAVAVAKANAAAAKSNLERTRQLVAQKYMSPAVLDKAQADYDAAEAQVQAAQVGKGHAQIVAPLAGIVAARHAEVGELAAPGRALFTIYEPGAMRLVVNVPQTRLAEVKASKRAIVEFPERGQRIESTAITVLPTIDTETQNAKVRVDLPASASFAIPGMAGRVSFPGAADTVKRMTVPKSAIVRRGEVAGVYVKDAQGKLRLRQLRLGETLADGEVEVLAGLIAGESYALDPIKAALAARR